MFMNLPWSNSLSVGCDEAQLQRYFWRPPCETWSIARTLECEEGSAPRPLRSRTNPLCLEELTDKELKQLEVSNYLLYVALLLLLVAIQTRTPAVMEHPREPKVAAYAAIWRLPWVRHMMTCKVLQRTLLWQAKYGSDSPKPTHFAHCWVPNFAAICQRQEQHVVWEDLMELRGKDAHGAWLTSRGKEYPSRLNLALASAHIAAVQSRIAVTSVAPEMENQIAQEFAFLYAGDIDQAAQSMQPDYRVRKLDSMD